MATNTILTNKILAKEILLILSNNLGFTKLVNRKYDKYFVDSGAAVGDTIQVRLPSRFVGGEGSTLVIDDYNERSVDVKITTQAHVGIEFTSKERTLNLRDFSDRILKPAIASIANKIDRAGLALAENVPNWVGDPTQLAATPKVFLSAKAKIESEGAPMDDNRSLVCGPYTQAGAIDGFKTLFNSQEEIGMQYKKGSMGEALGFDWVMSQNVINHTFGSGVGSPVTINGANQSGSTLIIAGLVGVLNKGDMFTIPGVYAVNPQSRETIGQLKQFTVTETTTANATTVKISPAITGPNGANKTQWQNVTALPANSAALSILGTAGQTVELNVAFHKDAFVLVSADLDIPGGVEKGVTAPAIANDDNLGLSVRIVTDYEIRTDLNITRVDVLFGWALVYPELACKVISRPDLF